jgi:hypothetical protein
VQIIVALTSFARRLLRFAGYNALYRLAGTLSGGVSTSPAVMRLADTTHGLISGETKRNIDAA